MPSPPDRIRPDPAREITAGEGDRPDRLDRFARDAFSLPSRSAARKLVSAGKILLNGAAVESSRIVKPGDTLALLVPPPAARPVFPLDFPVVYADEHMAAVLKPPGFPVSGNRFKTIENALPHNLPPSDHPEALPMPRPAHRLDVRTGGLLLVARTRPAQVGLGRLFETRQIHKRYRAILLGRLEGEGEVDLPIEGRDALSRYRAVAHTRSLRGGWLTSVDLEPVTGRTHQLRIHMTHLGHPILGDDLHFLDEAHVLRGKGLFLRALALSLPHPVTGEPLVVEQPEPQKFVKLRAREAARWERLRDI